VLGGERGHSLALHTAVPGLLRVRRLRGGAGQLRGVSAVFAVRDAEMSGTGRHEGPSTPTGGGDLMIGRKKSPKTEIGILNVRLHQIGIRWRIWTYLAKGYNFVIVSYVFAY